MKKINDSTILLKIWIANFNLSKLSIFLDIFASELEIIQIQNFFQFN